MTILHSYEHRIKLDLQLGISTQCREHGAMIPLMPWYFGGYLRTIRSLGFLMETLFRVSSPDPWKGSRQSIKEGI